MPGPKCSPKVAAAADQMVKKPNLTASKPEETKSVKSIKGVSYGAKGKTGQD